jgi:hypothetical protein
MAMPVRHIRLDVFCKCLADLAGNEKYSDAQRAKMTELLTLCRSRPDAIEIIEEISAKRLNLSGAIHELRRPRAIT